MKRYATMGWIACSAILGCLAVACGVESAAEDPTAAVEASREIVPLTRPGTQTDIRPAPAAWADVAPKPPRRAHVMSAERAAEVHPYVERALGPDTATTTIHSVQP